MGPTIIGLIGREATNKEKPMLNFIKNIFTPSPTTLADGVTLTVKGLKISGPNIYTCGQPCLDDIKTLKDQEFSLVVNLRMAGEFNQFDEEHEVKTAGLTYVSIPFSGPSGLSNENATTLHKALKANKKAGGKVLLHCAAGMRAVGLLNVHKGLYNDRL
jgi:protein tyrosine phosphatase (PTP) superfamily phosphohydrolase (DUF442 family)